MVSYCEFVIRPSFPREKGVFAAAATTEIS